MEMEKEMLIEIIQNIKERAFEQKKKFEQEKDEENKYTAFCWMMGLMSALSIIKNKIMEYHPLETDEEYEKVYKQYSIDCDIDDEFLNKKSK